MQRKHMLPGWTYIWLIRILSGEKIEKGSRKDTTIFVSFAATFPVVMLVFMTMGSGYLDKVGPLGAWLFLMLESAVLAGIWFLIYRYVNLAVTIVLAIIGWITCAVVGNIGNIFP